VEACFVCFELNGSCLVLDVFCLKMGYMEFFCLGCM